MITICHFEERKQREIFRKIPHLFQVEKFMYTESFVFLKQRAVKESTKQKGTQTEQP